MTWSVQASIGHFEERCSELKATSTVHESRAQALQGEGLSSTQVIDRLQVPHPPCPSMSPSYRMPAVCG